MPHSAVRLTKACTKGCMTNSKIATYVGFAQRSGAVLYGEDRIRENLSKCRVVLVDEAASEKYRTRLQSVCKNCPYFETEGLADATHRDNVKAVGITNPSLAEAIINLLR